MRTILFLLIPLAFVAFRVKEAMVANEAVLTVSGPGFKKDSKYIFPPDMVTTGGAEKLKDMTKLSFVRSFETGETFSVAVHTSLLKEGTVSLAPQHDHQPWGEVDIQCSKTSADGQSTEEVSMLNKTGTLIINTYTSQYVKGTFDAELETVEKKIYTVKGSFTLLTGKP